MKRLDRFILKSFVGPFLAILVVVIFILLLQFLWVYIDEIVGKGLGLRVVLEFMLWASCTVLPLALPLSTLLASMMTLGQMGENFELIAIKASGISLTRVMLPMMITSAVISVGAFFVCNNLVPYAMNQIYTMRDDFSKTKNEIKIPIGTFYDGIEGYILRIGDRDETTGMMMDVMVYDHSNGRGNTTLTVADSGIMKLSKAKDYLTFILYDGTNYQETNVRKYRDTTLTLQRIDFSKQELVIKLENYAFHKSDKARFSDQVKSMPLKLLNHGQDSLSALYDSSYVRHLEGFAEHGVLTKNTQLDTSWRRMNNFSDPDFLRWDSNDKRYQALNAAASQARQMESTLSNYTIESYEYSYILRLTNIEIFKKFAQALACLILFFIGAPLGALIRKGGLGTSAIVSVLFFVLYWVVDITGTKLAKDGAVTPFFGNFISAFVLFPTGLFLSWKAIHDSSLLGSDSFKSEWNKFKSKIMSLFKKTRIVYMGTPEFAVAPLQALVEKKYRVAGVVTVADKPAGRGLKLIESPVKQFAVANGIPVLQPEKLKDPEFLAALAAFKADIFVVVGFRMLPEEVWKMPRLGTFNLHTALLPQYRGAAPVNWAVINGESLTGATTFMIDKSIDTGGIILRQEIRIGRDETAGEVHEALKPVAADLVVQTVQGLIEGNAETRVQRSFIQGSELLKKAPKLTKELCHIDWNDSSQHIHNLIRGLSPIPTAYTELEKDGTPTQLKIFRAEIREDLHGTPGQVLTEGKKYFAVATADSAVGLLDVQLAGKKRMDVKAFLAGFRDADSYKATQGTSKAEIEKVKALESET
ncbi:MAG: methionyl-tRNA formyltransferase [Bacteroidales bacterium]|nr:methionyl-tRNA formyltransferase [Bacteroidales bacterium]